MITEPVVVSETNVCSAWRKAATLLLEDGERMGLVVQILQPDLPKQHEVTGIEPKNVDRKAMLVSDVANTIFPKQSDRWALPPKEFCEHYTKAYSKMHSLRPHAWGYYFQRFVAFGHGKVNQLERVVTTLNGWGRGHRAALVVHFSSAETDSPRPQGGPCLQYFQVGIVEKDRIGMIALYRSHDYVFKALGNFIGLSRILHYLKANTGLQVGPITCISSRAFLGGTKSNARKLLCAE